VLDAYGRSGYLSLVTTTQPRVGFGLLPGDPFWVQVREAVQQRAEALGMLLIPVPVPLIGSAGEAHLRFLDEIKAQELGALISHVAPESLMLAILNDGVPIICSEDLALRHPRLVSVHGLNRAAEMAADFLTARLAERGTILMVGGRDDPAMTSTLRRRGFLDIIERHGGLRCLHMGSGWRYDTTYAELLEEDARWLEGLDGSRIDAIFGLSDSLALAGRDACRKLGVIDKDTVIVGINGDPLAIAAIEAGTMSATIETSPADLGFNLAEYALRAAAGDPLPDQFPYSFELVTAENVAQVAVRKLVFIADLPSRLVDVNRRLEEQRLVQMETSLELNQRVGVILDQDELLATTAEIIGTRYAYERVHFYLWSHSDRTLTRMERSGNSDDGANVTLAGSGALGHALLHNQSIYIPDASNSRRYAPDPRWPDIRSRVILPVRVGGRILGVLDLHSLNRVVRNQAELDALQTLADEFGSAMRNAQLYAQALQARAEAVQAGLLRSRLLANVSHQLRSPLNVILGYCQAALATPNPYGVPLPAELLHDLRYIERSGGDLQRLVNDLLDLAQAETGTLRLFPEPVDIGVLLADVFTTASQTVGDHDEVRWRLQVPATLPALYADPVRLRNVLMNLLSNAARFTVRGQIVLGAEDAGSHVHLWVQDTGRGMTATTLARIRQSRPAAEAISPVGDEAPQGLGLAIAHHLVQLHDGELSIESEPGHGTTCHIFLPKEASALEMTGKESLVQDTIHQRHPRDRMSLQLVERVREFVANNYAGALTREQIAAELGVSPAYVSRVFRQQCGMALWDYVNEYRIARACELLKHSDLTVTEVAFTVGFNDAAYFSRAFRKETGQSPAAYRASF